MTSAVVLGGAGFLGSHIVRRLIAEGVPVAVIDGLVARTGGRWEHLEDLTPTVHLIAAPVEELDGLDEILGDYELVIDCMGWTGHRAALDDPLYDLRVNAESHLHLVPHLRPRQQVIYLGSRSQYGRYFDREITEDTPMAPVDIQGIHKLAAESYYRVYAGLRGLRVVSLRLPNCFGPGQPVAGADIGLVGGFIRTLLAGGTVEVYGAKRRRVLVYAADLAEVVARLAKARFEGFVPINCTGHMVPIEELVGLLIEITGSGNCRLEPLPPDLQQIDVGDAPISDQRLQAMIGPSPRTDLRRGLEATVAYFRTHLP